MQPYCKMKNEIERDTAVRFMAEQYVSEGYRLHFHRNIELYGVVKGTVFVQIAGEKRILTDGQMVIIDGLENHSYEIDGQAEVFYFHIGTRYCSKLYSLYPQNRLPPFLMDAEYNRRIYQQITPIIANSQDILELRRYGIVYSIFSDVIDHYGLVEKGRNGSADDDDVVIRVVQYIYDHYSERITLESLSKVFYISPKALSKKIRKRLNMDLRLFINDIRIQQAVQMRDDPKNKGRSMEDIAALCGFTNMATFYRSYERNFKQRRLDEDC